MTLDSWNSRSRRRVWLETRHTTGRRSLDAVVGAVVAVGWVCAVAALASLPEDLCLRGKDGWWASGECEAGGEARALRPREGGLSWAGDLSWAGEAIWWPKKCQLS